MHYKKIIILALIIPLSACYPLNFQQIENIAHPGYWLNDDIAGEDAGRNGIRDDIDEWIEKQNFEPKLKFAIQQQAITLQRTMVSKAEDWETLRPMIYDELDAQICVGSIDLEISDRVSLLMANTKARVLRADKIDSAFGGRTYKLPDDDNSTCRKY